MDEQFLIPGGEWLDQSPADEEYLIPGDEWVDTEGSPTPPGPGTRRRPVIVACG
jgi:hypothetical protein